MLSSARNNVTGVIAAGCVLSLTLAAVVGLPTVFSALHHIWTQVYAAFAHGYLALALAVWLGARKWRTEPPASVGPYWPAAIPTLAIGCLIAALGNMGLGATRLVLLPALLTCAIWWTLGPQVARIAIMPAALLHFALPPWALLDRPLQWLTTKVVNAAVDLTSIPAYVEGNHFHLAAGTFEIALGCSGLNYLITALTLFFFHGAAYLESARDRVRVLILAAVVAIVANWLRVYLLIAIGHWSDMEHYLVRVEHHYFGWGLFAVMMWPALQWAVSLEVPIEPRPTALRGSHIDVKGVGLAAVTGVVALASLRLLSAGAAALPDETAALPDSTGLWTADETASSTWQPEFGLASTSLRRYRHNDGSQVLVYRAAYARQASEARIDAPDNNLLGKSGASINEWPESIVSGGRQLAGVSREVVLDGKRMALFTIKATGGIPYRSRLEGMRAEFPPWRARTDAALVAIAAECALDCAKAEETVRRAATDMAPSFLMLGESP